MKTFYAIVLAKIHSYSRHVSNLLKENGPQIKLSSRDVAYLPLVASSVKAEDAALCYHIFWGQTVNVPHSHFCTCVPACKTSKVLFWLLKSGKIQRKHDFIWGTLKSNSRSREELNIREGFLDVHGLKLKEQKFCVQDENFPLKSGAMEVRH